MAQIALFPPCPLELVTVQISSAIRISSQFLNCHDLLFYFLRLTSVYFFPLERTDGSCASVLSSRYAVACICQWECRWTTLRSKKCYLIAPFMKWTSPNGSFYQITSGMYQYLPSASLVLYEFEIYFVRQDEKYFCGAVKYFSRYPFSLFRSAIIFCQLL